MFTVTRPSLVQDVCHRLVTYIQTLPAEGEHWLPTTQELTEKYGVSRTVLREAISRLEAQGLVEVKHGVGLKVVLNLHKPVSASVALILPDMAERLSQSLEARQVLEVEIAGRAASRINAKALQRLRRLQDRLLSADLDAAIENDLDFHREIALACGNEVLALMLESMSDLGRDSRRLTIKRSGIDRAHRDHQRILEALERGDRAAAAAAMRLHLEMACEDLRGQLSG